MAHFYEAIAGILKLEGGYSNNPNDRGGETYAGISRVHHPEWIGWIFLDSLKDRMGFEKTLHLLKPLRDLVSSFYRVEFWDRIKGDEINSEEIAHEILDTAVNQGITAGIKDAQRSVNLLNNNGKFGEDIIVDSVMGRRTVKELNSYPYPWAVCSCINGFQFSRYVQITEKDKSQEEFFLGWLKRIKL